MGKNSQIEGQMSLFDFLEVPSAAVEALKEQQLRINIPWPCRECKWHDGCCCEYDKKPEQYGECNLFVSRTPNFDVMSIEEAIAIIEPATGLKFYPTDFKPKGEQEYEAKFKKSKIKVHFSNYLEGVNNARRFLSFGIANSKGEGYGGPCDSVEEVIESINKRIRKSETEGKGIDDSFRPKDEEAYGERIEKPICKHSEHTCNKEELWRVAEDIGEDCPKSCCRACSREDCGARCNGAPKLSRIEKMVEAQAETTKACADCINHFETGCIVNNNFARYHKYDPNEWFQLPKCEHKNRFFPKSMSLCENKENCDDYPIHCKGECFWCHRNPNLSGDNCLNCRKYKIECFPEHAAVHGKCEKYKIVPDFYRVMRCQLCKYWSCSAEQPPAGWGIDGFCSLARNKTQAHSGCTYFEREGDTNGDREIQTDRSELLHTAEEEI